MKKALLIIVPLLFIILALVAAFMLRSPAAEPVPSTGGPDPLPVAGDRPTTDTGAPAGMVGGMTLASVDGGTIGVKNFLSDPVTVADQIIKGYYYLGYHTAEGLNDATATDTPPYVISYAADTQYFNIALLREPIGAVRKEVEQYLALHLGISETDLCRLKYMVSTPERVNATFASRNLGFSQCPGAAVLPL